MTTLNSFPRNRNEREWEAFLTTEKIFDGINLVLWLFIAGAFVAWGDWWALVYLMIIPHIYMWARENDRRRFWSRREA